MAAQLILTRKNEWANRLRKYKVYIDGEMVGTISNGQTEEFSLSVVNQTVRCKIDWAYSNVYDLNVSDGEVVYLRVSNSGKNRWVRYLFLFVYIFGINFFSGYSEPDNAIRSWLPVLLIVPYLLYLIYNFTIARHSYLQLQKDIESLFATEENALH